MKLISLNTWGGRLFEPLMKFIRLHGATTDIFCFQELYFAESERGMSFGVRADLAKQIEKTLPDFKMFSRLAMDNTKARKLDQDHDIHMGSAIFVRDSTRVLESGGFHTYMRDDESAGENIESVTGN